MAYHRSHNARAALGAVPLSPEQRAALVDVTPDELRSLSTMDKLDLALRHKEIEARKSEAFWNAVTGFATGVIPILAIFGLIRRR